jgi:H+/Cl- antiporter ClcA
MTLARTNAPTGWRAALIIPVAFTALGALSIHYPQLLGNGKGLAELAFLGTLSAGLAAVLAVLKSVATGVCLGSGAIGGLLTPSFAIGATLGALFAQLTGSDQVAGYALLGAAVVLAVAQRAPWTAIVLALEFTHAPIAFAPPIALAVALARITEHAVSGGTRWGRNLAQPRRAGVRRLPRSGR